MPLPQHMPLLLELLISHSVLSSLRDLGTSLVHLRRLVACHCQLSDVEGISALPLLRELHIAHNSIADLQPLQGERNHQA